MKSSESNAPRRVGRALWARALTRPAAVLLIGALPWGLSSCASGTAGSENGRTRSQGTTDAGRTTGADDESQPTEIVSVRVEPESTTLESIDGATPTEQLKLIGVQRNGDEREVDATWSIDLIHVGDIDREGVFTASGMAGGAVTITGRLASHREISGTGTVTVRVRRNVLGAAVDASAVAHFDAEPVADPTAIEVLYPLEGAVMPANVYPPTVQWAPVGGTGDLFRVRVSTPHVEINAIVLNTGADFGHGWLVPRDQWRVIADSDPDQAITIGVERFDAATSRLIAAGAPRTMRLARGSIFGAVYYEHRAGGANILRIDTETATLTDVISNPYPTANGTRCVGCHALSQDGRYLFGTNGETSNVYDVTTDLSSDPPPTQYPMDGGPVVASFDPTAQLFVGGSHSSGGLAIYDATTGQVVPSTGLPSAGAAYPSWSPDGQRLAYSGDIVVAPSGDPQAGNAISGNLILADRMTGSLDFSAARVLHRGEALATMPEGGTNDAHPAWSPDSKFVAFQHGTGTWTHQVLNPGALYLVGLDGAVHRLDHANGGPAATDGYWPTFAPYVTAEAGGKKYYWMAFYARRDYGNAALGTAGTGLRQLWVAAIDAEPTAGADPSFVPYWLPGQSTETSNFSAFWAPEACRATGDRCGSASECCSDLCEAGPDDFFVCTAPPPAECHQSGERCGGDADCCNGYECTGNVCTAVIM